MKVLILSGSFGMGHNSAAMAIAEKILAENSNAIIQHEDLVDYLFPRMSKSIYKLFNIVAERCHGIYNMVNRIAERIEIKISPPNNIFKKTKHLLEESQPDMIVCTLPLCAQLISAYKKKTNSTIPMATCITDICSHREWISAKNDLYFVPTTGVKECLMSYNVDDNLIHVTGIPVKEQFKRVNNTPKSNPLSTIKNLLIMGGGLGLLPDMDMLMKDLGKNPNLKIAVITGNNQKAFDDLYGKYENLEVIGFTDKVSDYMNNADAIITKAGGVTMFEAIHAETPILVIQPFLEQEINNAFFIEESGIGKVIWGKSRSDISLIHDFITNQHQLITMQNNLRQLKAEVTINSIGSIINEYGGRCVAS